MHVILGGLIVVGCFVPFLSAMQYNSIEFSGFFNIYAAILLGGVPIGLTVMTYRFSTLWKVLKGLGRTLIYRPERERERLAEKLMEFGREVRQDRGVSASNLLESEDDPIFRRLGRHVLEGTRPDEIESDAMILGRREMEEFRRSEKVLSTIGDFAPAMGMIGTVIGLIRLLSTMEDFENLGSGMAIALLTTFYGLLLAHLLYLPLARLVADHGEQRSGNITLVIEGMLKLARRRPLTELRDVVDGSNGESPARGTVQ
jgi:chemotaxis protein MotA